MKKNIKFLLLLLSIPLVMGSCSLFKEKCHCPKFGNIQEKTPNVHATLPQKVVQQ